MQVTELESKGLHKKFKIVVDAAQIDAQTEMELRAAGERVKIPGFRPGFIPLKVLQQRYGKSVQADVLKNVINRASNDVIAQHKLRPALTPQVNIENYAEGGDLTFTMAFETFPAVPEIAYDGISLDRKTFDIEEKDIDEAMERIAERNPTFVRAKKGAKAELGNVVTIDFTGTLEGVAFDGGSAKGFKLELGSGQFIEGFEDQLVGAKEGDERVVKVTFPEGYPASNLAGKDAEFAVTVHQVDEKGAPEINDEFAKQRGFADLRAFREAVRNQLIREYDQVVRNQLKKQLFDVLEEKYDFPLPESMVELEFNTIWERVKQAREQGDESVTGKSEEELKDEYQKIASRRVKLGLMLADVGTRNNVQIGREELSRAVLQQAQMFPGQEKKVMEFYRDNPERMDDLRGPILEEKAVDVILGKVKFNDSKVALDDLAGADEDEAEGGAEKKKKPAKAKAAKEKDEAEPKSKPAAKKKASGKE